MSMWTHVCGSFRVDCMVGLEPEPDFEDIFGRECLFDSPMTLWNELDENPSKFLPCGSEGTLQMSVWSNPDKHSMAAYTIDIFGDLRDYNDPAAIMEYFCTVCKRLARYSIRQAIMTANNESGLMQTAVLDPIDANVVITTRCNGAVHTKVVNCMESDNNENG